MIVVKYEGKDLDNVSRIVVVVLRDTDTMEEFEHFLGYPKCILP